MTERRKNFRLTTPPDVRRTLSRIANMVANGEMDTKTANTLILACNAVLNALRVDEQQKKIDELEIMLKKLS